MRSGPDKRPPPVLSHAGPARAPVQPAFWANGPFLVMRVDAELPGRCVTCNRPTDTFVRKRLYWADTATEPAGGAVRRLPLVGVFFAFQSMFRWLRDLRTFRTLVVSIPLCGWHRVKPQLLTVAACVTFPATLLLLRLPLEGQLRLWVPVLGLMASATFWARARSVKAVHVGIGYVTLAGAGWDYLSTLPGYEADAPRAVEDIAASAHALRERLAAKKKAAGEVSR